MELFEQLDKKFFLQSPFGNFLKNAPIELLVPLKSVFNPFTAETDISSIQLQRIRRLSGQCRSKRVNKE